MDGVMVLGRIERAAVGGTPMKTLEYYLSLDWRPVEDLHLVG
jgi:hypothetical protein